MAGYSQYQPDQTQPTMSPGGRWMQGMPGGQQMMGMPIGLQGMLGGQSQFTTLMGPEGFLKTLPFGSPDIQDLLGQGYSVVYQPPQMPAFDFSRLFMGRRRSMGDGIGSSGGSGSGGLGGGPGGTPGGLSGGVGTY